MKKTAKQLEQLERLAQIRSDMELKRFAAFRVHMDSLAAHSLQMREKLKVAYAYNAAFSVPEAQLANREAGRLAMSAAQLQTEIDRLRPSFDVARQRALREFGRVQVLRNLVTEAHVADAKGCHSEGS